MGERSVPCRAARTLAWTAAFWLMLLAMPGAARAQSDDYQPPLLLSGTLLEARETGAVTLAYRDASIPFSYLSARGEPIGYSIDLCRLVVDAMAEALNRATLEVRWLEVTPETRIDAIASGRADLECGSTTANLERAKQVAFSPTIFVSGTKLLVPRGSPIRSFRDLGRKKVAVTAGTTNERALRDLKARFGLDFALVAAADHDAGFALLTAGKVDAFATDEVLLYGLLAQSHLRKSYVVTGEFLSYDPYALMYRRDDPQMARLVRATFKALAADGELERRYKRWFLRRLPSGESLDLPMSPQLATIFEAIAAGAQ